MVKSAGLSGSLQTIGGGFLASPEELVRYLLILEFCGGCLGTADKLEMNQVIGMAGGVFLDFLVGDNRKLLPGMMTFWLLSF